MPSKSQYQDPHYIPVDLIEYLNEEEEEEERREQYRRDEPRRREEQIEASAYDYYLYFRNTHGLSHARAALAADYHPETINQKFIDTMPAAKKTSKTGTKVSKATYPKKATTTTTKSVDINKLVKAATERALSKNIETQHSCATIIMKPEYTTIAGVQTNTPAIKQKGMDMSPLNMGTDYKFNNTNLFAFNLSAMMQVRGSTSSGAASGWRQGFKVNCQSVSVDVRGKIPDVSSDCKYHMWICRKKDGIRFDAFEPSIIGFDTAGLTRARDGGPWTRGIVTSDTFQTIDRKNTETWSWPEKSTDHKSVSSVPRTGIMRNLEMNIYKKFDAVWEFNSDTAGGKPSMKDGDYCLFIFREGAVDPPALGSSITVMIDIAFKDA
jgi:hypothetical protein